MFGHHCDGDRSVEDLVVLEGGQERSHSAKCVVTDLAQRPQQADENFNLQTLLRFGVHAHERFLSSGKRKLLSLDCTIDESDQFLEDTAYSASVSDF